MWSNNDDIENRIVRCLFKIDMVWFLSGMIFMTPEIKNEK